MRSFDVIIPWRDLSIQRRRLLDWNLARWQALYGDDDMNIVLCDSDDEPFSRGKSRNQGVRDSWSDIIVLADADTVPMRVSLNEAMGVAQDPSRAWSIAYDEQRYYNLTREYTEEVLAMDPGSALPEPVEGQWEHKLTSWAGMLVVSRGGFELAGGYDERFVGWGWEDNAFQKTMDKKVGAFTRASGFVVHLWHPVTDGGFDTKYELANRELFHREYR